MGTEGTIELRKYMDIEGQPGGDHLFLTDGKGTRHMDCRDTHLDYGERLRDDVLHRTETAMPQDHCFLAMELALAAHRLAKPLAGAPEVTRLRVGVVGCGIGASHIEAYQAVPEMYEVAALCDIDAARAGAVAERLRIPVAADRLERLLESDLDIIDICTPSGLHQAQAVAVLEAGKHTVIEKPVAKSLAEVDAIAAAEAASPGRACPIFQYRFGHGLQKLAHLRARGYAGGSLGRHRRDALAARRGLLRPGRLARHLRRRARRLPRHARDPHPRHPLRGARPLASVHARTSRRLNRNETEDMAVLSLAFASGAFATSSVTLGSRQEMSRLRFVFDDLVAESGLSPYNPGHDPWIFPDDDPDAAGGIEAALADFAPLPERFVGQFHRLHAALTSGGPLPVTLTDARRSVELLTAAYYSAMTGEAVALPLTARHPFYRGWLDAMKEAARPRRAWLTSSSARS